MVIWQIWYMFVVIPKQSNKQFYDLSNLSKIFKQYIFWNATADSHSSFVKSKHN